MIDVARGRTVRGKVIDDGTGAPIASATVSLIHVNRSGTVVDHGYPVTTTSDGAGLFTLEPLPSGEVALSFAADGYASVVERVKVDGTSGQIVARLMAPGRLAVECQDRDGNIVEGIHVWAFHGESQRAYQKRGGREVVFGALPPGTYAVRAEVDAHSNASWIGIVVGDRVTLGPGEDARCVLKQPHGATIYGRVTAPEIAGRRFIVETGIDELDRNFTVDSGGEYRLEGLSPGRRYVTATSRDSGGTWRMTRTVDVVGDEELRIDFAFPSVAFEGRVLDVADQPIADAEVFVWPIGDSSGDRYPIHDVTAPDGTFQIGGLVAGSYHLRVRAEGFAQHDAGVMVSDEGSEVELRLEPEGVITVRVTDLDGDAVRSAEVLCYQPEAPVYSPLPATSPSELGWARVTGVSAGRWRVLARCAGYFPAMRYVDRVAGGKARADLELRGVGSLWVLVLDDNGTPIAGQSVELEASQEGDPAVWLESGLIKTSTGTLVTPEVGALVIDGLPEGPVRVTVAGEVREVEVRASEVVEVVVGGG